MIPPDSDSSGIRRIRTAGFPGRRFGIGLTKGESVTPSRRRGIVCPALHMRVWPGIGPVNDSPAIARPMTVVRPMTVMTYDLPGAVVAMMSAMDDARDQSHAQTHCGAGRDRPELGLESVFEIISGARGRSRRQGHCDGNGQYQQYFSHFSFLPSQSGRDISKNPTHPVCLVIDTDERNHELFIGNRNSLPLPECYEAAFVPLRKAAPPPPGRCHAVRGGISLSLAR